jgi:hypothetical protein
MKQADQARQLIGSAKQLRQSSDAIVKEKVFIKHNLTRVEAAVDYQERVQRRLAQQRRKEERANIALYQRSLTTVTLHKTLLRQTNGSS